MNIAYVLVCLCARSNVLGAHRVVLGAQREGYPALTKRSLKAGEVAVILWRAGISHLESLETEAWATVGKQGQVWAWLEVPSLA